MDDFGDANRSLDASFNALIEAHDAGAASASDLSGPYETCFRGLEEPRYCGLGGDQRPVGFGGLEPD